MKKILFALLVSFGVQAADAPSVHGMLLFGKDATYLSHLPMFHSPHEYQVILRVKLDAAAETDLKKLRAAAPQERVWTLVPERFVLPERVTDPKPFRADIYQGHFERGGKRVIRQATATMETVVHFRKFVSGAKPEKSQIFTFGTPGDLYSAHLIHGAPDFDRIAEVKVQSDGTLKEIALLYEEHAELE